MNSQKQRSFQGVVVSAKQTKTCIVRVDRTVEHVKYGKRYNVSKKFAVHDPEQSAKEGMTVEFEQCRPLSKTKRWKLLKVVTKE